MNFCIFDVFVTSFYWMILYPSHFAHIIYGLLNVSDKVLLVLTLTDPLLDHLQKESPIIT